MKSRILFTAAAMMLLGACGHKSDATFVHVKLNNAPIQMAPAVAAHWCKDNHYDRYLSSGRNQLGMCTKSADGKMDLVEFEYHVGDHRVLHIYAKHSVKLAGHNKLKRLNPVSLRSFLKSVQQRWYANHPEYVQVES